MDQNPTACGPRCHQALLLGALLAVAAPAQDAGERIAALRALAAAASTEASCERAALALGDRDAAVRRAAVEALLTLREDLEPHRQQLLEVVAERQREKIGFVWQAQVGIGGFAINGLVPIADVVELQSLDADVRRKAVGKVCRAGPGAACCLDRLLAMLSDPDADVRAAVAGNVGRVEWSDRVRDAVIAALDDPVAHVRGAAAEGLSGQAACAEVVDGLRSLIQDPDVDVRAKSLRALGGCGAFAEVAEHEILTSTRDREPKVRVAALEAVRERKMVGERAVATTLACLADRDRKVRDAALRAVQAQGPAAEAGLAQVLAMTRNGRYDQRRLAIETAWRVVPPTGDGAVALRTVEMLGDTSKVRKAAKATLRTWVDRDREAAKPAVLEVLRAGARHVGR